MSLATPENTSKPQELAVVCAQTCPCDLGGETEQIQSSPPLTPRVHVEGADGFSSSKCWVLAEVFERGRGYSQEKGVTFGGSGPAPTLPTLATKLLSPHFSHGSDTEHCKCRKQWRQCNPWEPPRHQGGQPGCGSARGCPPAQVTAIPLRNHTWRFMLCHC